MEFRYRRVSRGVETTAGSDDETLLLGEAKILAGNSVGAEIARAKNARRLSEFRDSGDGSTTGTSWFYIKSGVVYKSRRLLSSAQDGWECWRSSGTRFFLAKAGSQPARLKSASNRNKVQSKQPPAFQWLTCKFLELCWFVRKKNAPWYGKAGENTTVWEVPSPKFIMGGSDEEKFDHPTQKPVELMRRPILNHTKRGELIYEPFLGRGTTLAAAELTERVCMGIELDPKFVDIIVQRWQTLSNKTAQLEGDGRTFEEIARARHEEAA